MDPLQRLDAGEWRHGLPVNHRLGLFERIACHIVLAAYVLKHIPKLVRDLLIAGEQFGRRFLRRLCGAGKPVPMSSSKFA